MQAIFARRGGCQRSGDVPYCLGVKKSSDLCPPRHNQKWMLEIRRCSLLFMCKKSSDLCPPRRNQKWMLEIRQCSLLFMCKKSSDLCPPHPCPSTLPPPSPPSSLIPLLPPHFPSTLHSPPSSLLPPSTSLLVHPSSLSLLAAATGRCQRRHDQPPSCHLAESSHARQCKMCLAMIACDYV